MPLHTLVQLDSNTAYLLWKIEESVQELCELVILNSKEQQEYAHITHVKKQKEWLAARLCLRRLLINLGYTPSPLYKNTYGQPILATYNVHISISHCKEFALVALSQNNPIGIDIEQSHRKLRTIQHKFLNEVETKDANSDLSKLCIYWCAKEAIYKTLGGNNISLKNSIYIYPFIGGSTKGTIWGQVAKQLFKVQYTSLSTSANYYLAWSQGAC